MHATAHFHPHLITSTSKHVHPPACDFHFYVQDILLPGLLSHTPEDVSTSLHATAHLHVQDMTPLCILPSPKQSMFACRQALPTSMAKTYCFYAACDIHKTSPRPCMPLQVTL